MIRTFNYTERQKINLSAVDIRIKEEGTGRSFDAGIDLKGLDLPSHARVYVEAYHKSNEMRFDFGTVANPTTPENTLLMNIAASASVLFRVKVVDESEQLGRMLAVADRVRPSQEKKTQTNRKALLPVDAVDLKEDIWKLQIDPAGCVLQINSRIANLKETITQDPTFFGLVFPSVLRQVLQRILIIDRYDASDEDQSNWRNDWMEFSKTLDLEVPDFTDEDEENDVEYQLEWIEKVVSKFSQQHSVLTRFNQSREFASMVTN